MIDGMGSTLPPNHLPAPVEPAAFIDFLQDPLVSSLFSVHPNRITEVASAEHPLPPVWEPWWNWAADTDSDGSTPKWVLLVQRYIGSEEHKVSLSLISHPGEDDLLVILSFNANKAFFNRYNIFLKYC
jgi:hypothetical protein